MEDTELAGEADTADLRDSGITLPAGADLLIAHSNSFKGSSLSESTVC